MKLTCEYCDSYLEIESGTLNCPCCGAPLGVTLRDAAEKEKAEKAAREAAEEKRLREEREARQTEQILSAVTTVASSGLLGSGITRLIRKKVLGAGSRTGGGSFLWGSPGRKRR